MQSPFPGMNPYLEHHALWHEVHTRLIVALADYLNPFLRPRYLAYVEERSYLAVSIPDELTGMPDLTVVELNPYASVSAVPTLTAAMPRQVDVPMLLEEKQRYLHVREIKSGEIITAVELLSYVNKSAGDGREEYEEKRNEILATKTHLVEIDLLRARKPMPVRVHGAAVPSDYRILVSRAETRPRAELYAFNVQDEIPVFALPLQRRDVEPRVNLNELIQLVYDRGGYDLRVDYNLAPDPQLRGEKSAWAENLLREQNLRTA